MKLRCSFEMMDLDDHFVAVSLGEDDQGFHGVIKLNKLRCAPTEEAIRLAYETAK